MKNKRGAKIINVYQPVWWKKLGIAFVCIVLVFIQFPVLVWANQSEPREFPSGIFLFLIPLYGWMLWYTIIFMTQTRLIVYEDGIAIQRGGSHFFSTWENMSHFGRRGSGKNVSYGIYLYQSVQPEVNGLAEKLFYGWAGDYLVLSEMVSIHIKWLGLFQGSTVDTEKLLATEFGQELYRFAPHLFESEKAKHGYA